MKSSGLRHMNNQKNKGNFGQRQRNKRCELCNMPIYGNPSRDVRSSGVLKGKGKTLCHQCASKLIKLTAAEALKDLNAAAEANSKE